MSDGISDVLTNLAIPKTSATLTLRIIKSFEFRTERSLVLHNVNLDTTTVGELKELARQGNHTSRSRLFSIPLRSLSKPSQDGNPIIILFSTTNLIINLDHEDWILNDDAKTLTDIGFENETEVSFFNREAYEKFKAHPEIKWES
ncbi:hypothetical protein A0H81_04701 [Grifola frondosa]|uniref:Uncharacterized protein n=1 Tax=Grifola frondosa TaxID=5627 RepID=A0A1C7MGJ8_GRIFR|nr:hypothetical protein A0H81_04701 [Grifola frondosa]